MTTIIFKRKTKRYKSAERAVFHKSVNTLAETHKVCFQIDYSCLLRKYPAKLKV